jgi:hypothetical protein
MPTEVYSCLDGQEIKQGKLDYCEVETREAAEADARRRCAQNNALKRIAYYKVSPDGAFRLLLTYENPYWKPARRPGAPGNSAPAAPAARTQARPAAKQGLLARIKDAIGLS